MLTVAYKILNFTRFFQDNLCRITVGNWRESGDSVELGLSITLALTIAVSYLVAS
jgi:hypothetical protein